VKLSLSIDDEIVSSDQGGNLFEFRKQRKNKNEYKSPIPMKNNKDIDTSKLRYLSCIKFLDYEYKIRIVEKMREYDNKFGPIGQSGRAFENQDIFTKYLEANINEMSDLNSLLSESEVLEILQFMNINKPAGKETEFKNFLDSVDRDGYTIVHYLCYLSKKAIYINLIMKLGYNECLLYALGIGASANIASSTGVTALEISLHLKNEVNIDLFFERLILYSKCWKFSYQMGLWTQKK